MQMKTSFSRFCTACFVAFLTVWSSKASPLSSVQDIESKGSGATIRERANQGPQDGVQIVNIVPEFLQFWDDSRGLNERDSVALFQRRILFTHPALFAADVVGLDGRPGSVHDSDAIASFLRKIGQYIPAMRAINERLGGDLSSYTSSFAKVFPDFRATIPVYFTISMDHFDGATRIVNGKDALLFGVDMIARLYGPTASLSVLFDHELFHQYHLAWSPPATRDELSSRLWEEGLATYVSWRLNPSSDQDDVLLSQKLSKEAAPVLPTLAKELLEHLSDDGPSEYSKFFLGHTGSDTFPSRSGYFVGFQVVAALGLSCRLVDLAHASGEQLRIEIMRVLTAMASSTNVKLAASCPFDDTKGHNPE